MRESKVKGFVFIFVWLVLAGLCSGKTLVVDSNGSTLFSQIQTAINMADDGDVIEIQPGTYMGDGNRDIDFIGRAITVRGQVS